MATNWTNVTKAENEGTDKTTFERTSKLNNRTSENASQTNGKWPMAPNKHPQTRQPNKWLRYTYSFSKRREAGASLVPNIEKRFRLGFKNSRNRFDNREIKHHVYGNANGKNTTWSYVSRHFTLTGLVHTNPIYISAVASKACLPWDLQFRSHCVGTRALSVTIHLSESTALPPLNVEWTNFGRAASHCNQHWGWTGKVFQQMCPGL